MTTSVSGIQRTTCTMLKCCPCIRERISVTLGEVVTVMEVMLAPFSLIPAYAPRIRSPKIANHDPMSECATLS